MCYSLNHTSAEHVLTGDEPELAEVYDVFGLAGVIQYTTLTNNQLIAQDGLEDAMYDLFCEREMSFFIAPATNTSILRH